jgi:hypothetical protein
MSEAAAIVPATDGDASLREALQRRIRSIRWRVATSESVMQRRIPDIDGDWHFKYVTEAY